MDEQLTSLERWRYVVQAENSLIGCLLVDPENTLRMIRGTVTASDFQSEAGRAVYQAASTLIDSGKPADPVLIQAEAEKLGLKLDNQFCAEAMRLYTTTANASATAQIVHEAAAARAAHEIGSALISDEITPLEALGKLQELLRQQGSTVLTPLEASIRVLDHIVAASQGKEKPFISTGYKSLDAQLSGGIVQSGLFTLAARPGTGKTTVALNICERVAAAGGTVLYFSQEMDLFQIWEKRLAALSGLSYSAIHGGQIRDDSDEWERLTTAAATLSKRNFLIQEIPSTVEEIEQEARCTKDLTLLCVDHIGLCKPSTGKGRFSRYELITGITHQLKQLALSLHIPILALCQLNRASVQRESKRPTMADLRDSGAIEEDSDVVCLLFREAQYLQDEHQPKPWESQPIDFIIDKNRHGMTGTVTLKFFGINSRIIEEDTYR